MSRTSILFLAMVGLFVVGFSMTNDDPAPVVETPEQIAARVAQKHRDSVQYVATASAAKLIKASMRDPSSIVFESLRVSDDAKTVCAEYRGKNGFGGMTQETAVVVDGAASGSQKAWNRRCTGAMRNMMYVAQTI